MLASAQTQQPIRDPDAIRALLTQVTDPEIPVLTLTDLGVLREVLWEGEKLVIVITPTYSGCPAVRAMEDDIRETLRKAGYRNVDVRTRLAPAWTTDWLSEAGRAKLHDYGIAPPVHGFNKPCMEPDQDVSVQCPRCDSTDTKLVSRFGSTACKALYKCNACLEPFDYFKCL